MSKMRFLSVLMAVGVVCGALALRAESLPDGFVFRAGVTNVQDGGAIELRRVTIRLYAEAKSAAPLWTGWTNDVSVVDGVFQIWVSEGLHDKRQLGETQTLETLFERNQVHYLGVTFNNGAECLPRRPLMTVPLAHYAVAGGALDEKVRVKNLWGVGQVEARNASFANVTCDTLAFSDADAVEEFAVDTLNVGGVTVYRDDGNLLVGGVLSVDVVTNCTLRKGSVIHNDTGCIALLTIMSADRATAPCLTLPVPEDGDFVWTSDDLTCTWRMVKLGIE